MLSNTPKIIFVGMDDKPIDLSQALTNKAKLKQQSTAADQLASYYKALYLAGEATQ